MKLFFFMIFFTVVGCTEAKPDPKDSGYHSSMYPTCDEIIDRCHPFDVGKGPIHDCHDIGHGATSDEICKMKKDECFKICVPMPDAATSDAPADAVSDAPQDTSVE